MTTRRQLLGWLSALLAAPRTLTADEAGGAQPAGKPLDLLFLGGTGFLGRHQVRQALARGHRVTLFNRGRTAPGLYGKEVEVLLGNRDSRVGDGLKALQGTRRWDVVIDNSGYVPRHVQDSLELLRDRCRRYIYVSTIAAYEYAPSGRSIDESAPLQPAPLPTTEKITDQTYGALKAECDRVVQARLGPRATIVRPTFIIGPGDETDRFTYWVDRVARGGDVLAPPDPDAELQFVDVRDLCTWMVELAERDVPGIFNAAGPLMTWRRVLQELGTVATRPVNLRWSNADVLQRANVNLPLVRQPGRGRWPHYDGARAAAAGLRYRPLAETAAATLEWWRSQGEERRAKPQGWPTEAQEKEALRLLEAS
jgi:2'-hydroxyisoflavone reductase